MQEIAVYLLLINLIVFILMIYDKRLAIKHQPRIPEKTLLSLSLIGGSFGCLSGMVIAHHKVRKSSFYIPLLVIFLTQGILFYFLN